MGEKRGGDVALLSFLNFSGRRADSRDMLSAESGTAAAQAHYLRGESLAKDRTTRRLAAEEFSRAAEILPQWSDAHYHAAANYFNIGDSAAAERCARGVLQASPDHAGALWLLGQALLELDRGEEALACFERVLEVAPETPGVQREVDKLKGVKRAPKRTRPALHPRLTSDYDDFDRFAERFVLTEVAGIEPFLTKRSKCFTAGSCFAANIALGLTAQGIAAATVGVPEEINSTYANRYLFEWILDGPTERTATYQEYFGEEKRREYRDSLASADVVIISLGVAPCFFHRETGEFAATFGTHLYSQQHEFRTTSVAENVANIKAIVACLQRLNPAMKIVLTVSPVPLKGTLEMRSAVVADSVSKSTLRVAAHEVTTELAGQVIYWPSFEMVRWYGGHAGRVFGNDDESAFHVSQDLIARILSAFIRHFSIPGEL